ncbi:hypothetical protein JG687_00016024 [Phytophthora cactorum]|uniref:DNA polymerase delta subunit 3 n=1 Tax=Phytophthora cactorum TaxID=29920 RepID=A0A8T1TVF7_9STRA|nr:hypothetical protein PC123_g23922 [Phytophthora cactorum]KAG6947564.1 hypothetical protein JG687_00016024 [Phytophthora cactorum]
MERCLDEISSTVLDAGEPISYRTLSIRSQVPTTVSVEALASFSADNDSVKALQVLIKRATIDNDRNKSETAAAKRDPRARVISIASGNRDKANDVFCQQIYALCGDAADDADQVTAMTTACWAQERQTRNDVLSNVPKHAPLSAAAKVLYASSIKCAEATARQAFGEDQGEETISVFDAINASAKKKPSSSSFFKSSGKAGFSKASSSRNGRTKTASKPEATKLDMSNVLTVDSDDEEDDETDAPVFVKKTTTNKRIISDDEDEEDEAPAPKKASTPAPKSRNVKRKLNASPAETKKAKEAEESEAETCKKQRVESEDEDDESVEEPVIATKRRVLVSKTRINEQGYMVTEKTYKEVELTPEEIEKEQKAAKKKLEDKKKKAAADKAATAKKEAKKHSGPPKQRDLRSFFSVK